MAIKTKDQLKTAFAPGAKPSSQDFADLIDSLLGINDLVGANQQAIDTALNAYSTGLTARNVDGTVNTLGDVYFVLSGYDDSRNINDELKWSGLPGRPASLFVQWTEQILMTDSAVYNPNATTGTAGAGAATRWLLQDVRGLTGLFTITDIQTERHFVTSNGTSGNFFDSIVALKVAIQPKINLT